MRYSPMRMLDCFAGIGGFHYGVKDSIPDVECVGMIEISKQSRYVYKLNFPSVPQFEDITQIDIPTLPSHDILTGGFPCQSFSVNRPNQNNVLDLRDSRSNLINYLIEILKYHRPEYFIFENVDNILKIEYLGTLLINSIVSSLEDLGYTVRVSVLNAVDFGSPQIRKRCFIYGNKSNTFNTITGIPNTSNVEDIRIPASCENSELHLENVLAQDLLLEHYPRYLRLLESVKSFEVSDSYTTILLLSEITGDTPSKISRQSERLYSSRGVAPTLTASCRPFFNFKNGINRKLCGRECLRLQAFPDSHVWLKPDNLCAKQAGNAVNVNCVSAVIRSML